MAVIIEKNTKILIQGFTGKMGTFHAEEMIKYGSESVGYATPIILIIVLVSLGLWSYFYDSADTDNA